MSVVADHRFLCPRSNWSSERSSAFERGTGSWPARSRLPPAVSADCGPPTDLDRRRMSAKCQLSATPSANTPPNAANRPMGCTQPPSLDMSRPSSTLPSTVSPVVVCAPSSSSVAAAPVSASRSTGGAVPLGGGSIENEVSDESIVTSQTCSATIIVIVHKETKL